MECEMSGVPLRHKNYAKWNCCQTSYEFASTFFVNDCLCRLYWHGWKCRDACFVLLRGGFLSFHMFFHVVMKL